MRAFRIVALALAAVAASAAPASASTPHYSTNTASGQVLRWNPCATIPVRLNLSRAPRQAKQDVEGALQRVTSASGLHFHISGSTSTVPTGSGWDHYAGITIAWAANRDSDKLNGHNAGEGGYYATASSTDGGAHWTWRIRSGFVVIDTAYNSRVRSGFGRGGTQGALLLHELGHAVGLNHVSDPAQMMYPVITSKAASYGSGDRAGLVRVGRPAGCIR